MTTSLPLIPLFLVSVAGEGFDPWTMGSVFVKPSGVISKNQDRIIETGNPMMSRMITRVTVQSGRPSLGNMISAASMIIKAVAAYMALALITLRLLSSCQNCAGLLPGDIALLIITVKQARKAMVQFSTFGYGWSMDISRSNKKTIFVASFIHLHSP
jgi:hypothetical protein